MEPIQVLFAALLSTFLSAYGGYYILCTYVSRNWRLDVRKDRKYAPSVSIVIPTWNEEGCIKGKMENTIALDYPKGRLEIIVVDSGSKDRTRDIVRKFKRARLIVQKRRLGKARALNEAFRECRGDIVVISDADCRLDKGILKKSMPYFADSSVGGITGRQVLINPAESLATNAEKAYRDFYYVIRDAESKIDSTLIFHGEFSAFRRELLEDIFEDSVADDSEMALRIRKKNYRTLFVPEATYREYSANSLSDRLMQKYRRAQGLVQIMFRFFKTFFFNPKYGRVGMLIFPMEFFMHAISPFLLVAIIATLLMLPWNIIAALAVIILVAISIPKLRIIIFSFFHSQLACLKGVVSYFVKGPSYSWEKVGCTRRYSK